MSNTLNSIAFHHLCVALNDFSKALKFYKNLGYKCTEPVVDPLQNVELVLCTSEFSPTIELVRPISEQSPVINYLKRSGEIVYHTCYEVDDIEKDVKEMFLNNRAICVSRPKPAILFENRLAAFYYVNEVGLIEILQRNK